MADQHQAPQDTANTNVSDPSAPAPAAPRSPTPEPEETADGNMDDTSAIVTSDGPSPARGWWQEAAHATKAWAKLIAALDLTPEKAAALFAAKPVETALWHYDEQFLQPRLKLRADAIAAQAQGVTGVRRPRRQPTEHEKLMEHTVPVGSSAYTMPMVTAMYEEQFADLEAKLRTQPRYRGACQHLHAQVANWRILRWLQTPEAAALGLGHLFVNENRPELWGQAKRVPGVMLEYLFDFEAETSVVNIK
ncbi:hypothetical protein PG984_006192 [Apiospora sp. TS-2023a]